MKRCATSTRFIISPACRACGCPRRATSMPSISTARRSCLRQRASAASHASCIARPNPSCSGRPRCNKTLPPSAACCRPRPCPALYTRSKMLAEQPRAQAAAAGFPLVIGTPTMPIGPHDHNLTPPTAMLRHFLHGRVQMYLDFIVNMVDVRDVATGPDPDDGAGANWSSLHPRRRKHFAEKNPEADGGDQRAKRRLPFRSPASSRKHPPPCWNSFQITSRTGHRPARPRVCGSRCGRPTFRSKRRNGTWLCATPDRTGAAGYHRLSAQPAENV